ncbi:MAG: DMT family transporter [Simkaniaceae bacterium]|nr:DMT family transporter [Simkaniaceae bacterium]
MLKTKDLPGILLLALLWSPTFLIVRIAIHEIPPISLTLQRVFWGAIVLVILCTALRKNWLVLLKKWWLFVASTIVLNAIPFTLCSVGEIYIDSSTAGIIEGSTPIFTLLFARYIFKSRDIDRFQVAAIITGFIGLLVIFLPTVNDGNPTSSIGFVTLVLMAAFFAFGFLFSERFLKWAPALESVTLQMVLVTIILVPFAHYFEHPKECVHPSWWVLFLVFLLGAVGTSAAWLTYFVMVKRTGAKNVALATMFMPIFSLFWGRIFLGEPITWYKILGICVVLLSVFSMSLVGREIVKRLLSLLGLQSKEGDH